MTKFANKKGESGIGTLIIFIAMLLVAAIAAGVLIQTTGALQNKALITGQQSKSQISTHLEAMSLSGTNGTDSDVENITILTKLSAGSESIDLNKTIIIVDTPYDSESLTYTDNSSLYGVNGYFHVTYFQNGTDHQDGYLKMGDVAELGFLISSSLGNGQTARFDIIPKIGIPTTVEVVMPETVSQYRVHLYP